MNIKVLPLIILLSLCHTTWAQQTIQHSQSQVLYDNGLEMMKAKNFAAARSYFDQYILTGDTIYLQDAQYNTAISGLKLYHLDGEKLIQDFIIEYPVSPLSSKAYIEMGEYFFQDRNYKQAIVYLAKVDQTIVAREDKARIQYKLGYSYFTTKKFKKALIELNKVKKTSNKFQSPAKYYAGFIEYDNADYSAALKDYQAIEHDKSFAVSVPYMITSIHYKSGDYNQLIKYAKAIIDNNRRVQKKGQMAILLAESYYKLSKYSDAYHYFTIAIKSEKFTTQSIYHYGMASSGSGQNDKAINLLKSIAGQNNKIGVLASYAVGQLYLNTGNDEFAFTAFKSVMNSKNVPGLIEEARFTAGKLAYDLKRYSESITILAEFQQNYPQSNHRSAANDILAQAFVNTRNYKSALNYIESLEVRSKSVKQAYQMATYHYGIEFYNDRKFLDAIKYFNKSLAENYLPKYTLRANLWTAEAYSLGRRFEQALPYYNAAIALGEKVAAEDYWRAIYGRGYAYFNTKKYSSAQVDFKNYIDNVSKSKTTYGDALVRLADSYYVAKNYTTAIQYFNQAINSIVNEKDYAYYRAGVIYGILDNTIKAYSYLDRVIKVFSTSTYYDDALFEKGLLQLGEENFAAAIATFKQLIKDKSRSRYVAYAIERMAVANFNLGNYGQTVTLYQQFIDSYPKNPKISDALIGLQESLRLLDRSDEFDKVLAAFRAKNPDVGGLEEVEFESLKAIYNNQDYEKAASGLEAFLTSYPDDINTLEARYLLAESLYRLQKSDEALKIYYQLYAVPEDFRVHRITERIADIELSLNNLLAANKYYTELVGVAVSNNQKFRAWVGLTKGHYLLGQYDSTIVYAEMLIENAGNRNDFVVVATLRKGLALMNLGRFDNALLMFERTTQLAKDKNGAQAQYFIGVILNQQSDFTSSNEALYVIPEQYGIHTEWLDKAFLLVAENFIGMKEYFQARATLQSIIDNSADATTIQTATDRYEWLANEEARESNIIADSLNTVELDTTKNDNE